MRAHEKGEGSKEIKEREGGLFFFFPHRDGPGREPGGPPGT